MKPEEQKQSVRENFEDAVGKYGYSLTWRRLNEYCPELVILNPDQSLPTSGLVVLLNPEPFIKGFHLGQQRMIEAGWRKVEVKDD